MVEYPIVGPLRLVLLGLEGAIIFLSLRFTISFLVDYVQGRRALRMSRISLLWGIFFLMFGGMYAFYIKSDFYSTFDRQFFLNLGYIWANAGILIFSLLLENFDVFKFKGVLKHFFSIIFTINFILIIYFSIMMPDNTTGFVIIPLVLAGILLLRYCIVLYKRVQTVQRRESLVLMISVICLYGGYLLTTDMINNTFGDNSRLLGDLIIIGMLVLSETLFSRLPSIEQFGWYDLLEQLYVVNEGGIALYRRQFNLESNITPKDNDSITNTDEQLQMGVLTGTKQAIEAIMESGSKVQVITQEDKTFLLEYKEGLTFLLVCKRALPSHRILLAKFAKEFMNAYSDLIKEGHQEVHSFRSADGLVDQVFRKY